MINEQWQVWMLKEQRKYNLIMALGTLIISIVGILQIMKIYDFYAPDWFFMTLGAIIVFCVIIIISTFFD